MAACSSQSECGDEKLQDLEECDDGNVLDGDGCSSTCQFIECGDSRLTGEETCDDGGTDAGDGCSDTCTLEDGWDCEGEPTVCDAVCGDGLLRDAEACDDGGTDAGDGCSDTCTIEDGWACDGEPSTCEGVCGDGLIRDNEVCDDGGTDPDDGCTPDCAVQDGWECTGEPSDCVELQPEIEVEVSSAAVQSGDEVDVTEALEVGTTSLGFTITVRNTGAADLNISDLSFTSGHATHFIADTRGLEFVIAPGESSSGTAYFAPSNGGIKSATLAIVSDDEDEGTFELNFFAHTAPNTYRDISTTTSPSGRFNAKMVDLKDGRVLMFGGRDASRTWLNDTWLYDIEAADWTEVSTKNAPSARDAYGMAYGDQGQVILFGGNKGSGGTGKLADTWEFDVASLTWSELSPGGSTPPARFQHSMLNIGDGLILMYGGRSSVSAEVDDTWLYDAVLNSWTDVSTKARPTPLSTSAIGFDGTEVTVFGGFSSNTPYDEVWSFDPAANTWTQASPTTRTTPGARAVLSGAYFEGGEFIVHSGKLNSCCVDPTAGTYAWDPRTQAWSDITPDSEPTPYFNYAMAYIEGDNKAIIFGGLLTNIGVNTALDETREYVGPLP